MNFLSNILREDGGFEYKKVRGQRLGTGRAAAACLRSLEASRGGRK